MFCYDKFYCRTLTEIFMINDSRNLQNQTIQESSSCCNSSSCCAPHTPKMRSMPKVGRNEPCVRGS